MANFMRMLAGLLLLVCLLPAGADTLTIGYVDLKGDPRYRDRHTRARYLLEPTGRPLAGARLALAESQFVGQAVGVEFDLKRVSGRDKDSVLAAIDELAGQGVHFFLLDLPGELMAEVAAATKGKQLLLFNISAPDDSLRQEQCQAHLLHVPPNYVMQTDALVQYLVSRKWPRLLVLRGPNPEDAAIVQALERSAKRYGGKIVEIRDFVLSNDPREREQNNVALITGGAEYDVVYVADSNGEFARDVPYHTLDPRPVVGSAGLGASAWHWAWERHGAPQLNNRFLELAKRDMTGTDWPAWLAVKALVEAVLRTQSTEYGKVREFLLSDAIILDGFKGNRLNFRSWDNQLRQPLLLVTDNWVVERAPLKGFLHPTNNMDTLGFDQPESRCEF